MRACQSVADQPGSYSNEKGGGGAVGLDATAEKLQEAFEENVWLCNIIPAAL